jgi:hypothetical protein
LEAKRRGNRLGKGKRERERGREDTLCTQNALARLSTVLGYFSVEEVDHFAKGIKTANLVALKWASHFAETSKDNNGTRQWSIDLV